MYRIFYKYIINSYIPNKDIIFYYYFQYVTKKYALINNNYL